MQQQEHVIADLNRMLSWISSTKPADHDPEELEEIHDLARAIQSCAQKMLDLGPEED